MKKNTAQRWRIGNGKIAIGAPWITAVKRFSIGNAQRYALFCNKVHMLTMWYNYDNERKRQRERNKKFIGYKLGEERFVSIT